MHTQYLTHGIWTNCCAKKLIGPSKSFWSDPNHFGQFQIILNKSKLWKLVQKSLISTWTKSFGPDQNYLDLTKMIWNWPRQFVTVQNHFGPIEGTRHFVDYNHQTKVRQKNPVTIFCKRIGQNLVKTLSLAQAKFRAYLKITCLEVIYDKVQEHSLYKKYN